MYLEEEVHWQVEKAYISGLGAKRIQTQCVVSLWKSNYHTSFSGFFLQCFCPSNCPPSSIYSGIDNTTYYLISRPVSFSVSTHTNGPVTIWILPCILRCSCYGADESPFILQLNPCCISACRSFWMWFNHLASTLSTPCTG